MFFLSIYMNYNLSPFSLKVEHACIYVTQEYGLCACFSCVQKVTKTHGVVFPCYCNVMDPTIEHILSEAC